MPGQAPPVIKNPNSLVFGGVREAVILGTTLALCIAVVAIPIPIPFKIGIDVFLLAIGLGVAYWKMPPDGGHFEDFLLTLFKFSARPRLSQRNTEAASNDLENAPWGSAAAASAYKGVPASSSSKKPSVAPSLSFDFSTGYILNAISLSVLAALVAWALTGGVQDILFRMGG